MKPEKLTILNDRDEKLVGLFYKSPSNTIIIVCHGIDSSNHFHVPHVRDAYRKYLYELNRVTKVNVFSFDFSGFGESEGESSLSLRKRDSEIKFVIDYFVPKYEDIILYGFSYAGVSTAIAATRYREIKKLITINGLFTLNPLLLYFYQIFTVVFHFLRHPGFWADFFFWIHKLKPESISIPTFVAISRSDPLVRIKQSKHFYNQLISKKKFVVIPCDDHAMVKENFILADEIAKWLKETEIEK